MSKEANSDFVLVDTIASEAYVSTMITCLLCESDLMASDLRIDEANDPMDKWAQEFSIAAKGAGWSISNTGAIVCPKCSD